MCKEEHVRERDRGRQKETDRQIDIQTSNKRPIRNSGEVKRDGL